MTNEIETSRDFQERVFERIRADIGNLMTDVELKSLLNAAMQKAFFEPVKYKDRYGYSDREEPPVIISKIKDLMSSRVGAAVDKWIEEHPEEVNKAIKEVLAGGIAGAVAMHLETRFSAPLAQLRAELEQKGFVEKRY